MADIRLILTSLELELDVPQDRQFPLALNYTAGSLKHIESRSTDFSLEFRIPANKKNKTALDHLNSTNIEDGNLVLARNACRVTIDNMPVFAGDFKLLGLVDDRGHEEFKCIILGSGMGWAESMKSKTPRDYNWGTHDYTKAEIEKFWDNDGAVSSATAVTSYNDGGITYPLINYGAWGEKNYVTVEDFKPAMFMRSFFEKAFAAEGYTLQADTDSNDFFHTTNNPIADQVIFPFTGTGWVDSTGLVTDNYFEAVNPDTKTYAIQTKLVKRSQAYGQTEKGRTKVQSGLANEGTIINQNQSVKIWLTDASSLPSTIDGNTYVALPQAYNSLLKSPLGTVYRIIGYGTARYSAEALNKDYIEILGQAGAAGVANTYINPQTDSPSLAYFDVIFGEVTGGVFNPITIQFDSASPNPSSVFNTTTNKYTAPTGLKSRFRFDCEMYSFSEDLVNEGTFTFRIIHKSGSTTTVIGQEFINPTEDSNMDEFAMTPYNREASVIAVGLESGNVNMAAGDEIYVDVVIDHTNSSAANRVLFGNAPLNTKKSTFVSVKNAELESIPQSDIIKGYTGLAFNTVLDDRYNSLQYIKGCLHAFNLMIKTDPIAKTVIVKSRDEFYDDNVNAIDWTDKLDIKKQFDVSYLNLYKRELNFKFKDDGADAYLSELNRVSSWDYGSMLDTLSDRFDDGEQKMENPLFAYTHQMIDRSILGKANKSTKGIVLARMWNEYSPSSIAPSRYYNYKPRLLIFENAQQNSGSTWLFEGADQSTCPSALVDDYGTAAANIDFDLHLGYNNSNDNGLYQTYYQKTINTIEKGTKLAAPFYLTKRDIHNFDISKPVYIGQPANLKGYWLVDKISNFLPNVDTTTTVELIKREDFDTRTVESTYDNVIVLDNKEWVSDDHAFVDVGDRGGGDSKSDAKSQADLADASERADKFNKSLGRQDAVAGAGVSAVQAASGSGGKFAGKAGAARFNATDTRDSVSYAEAEQQAQTDDFSNSKNVVGISDYDGMSTNPYVVKHESNNTEVSMVQRAKGNVSKRGTGNFVTGRNNIAAGSGQTVVGQYSKPSSTSAFSVGTGNSDSERYNALSVDKSGIVREGGGALMDDIDDVQNQIYEEINGEMVKVVI
jgi:hypothetical protein